MESESWFSGYHF